MKTEPETGCHIPTMTAAIDILSIAFLWCASLIVTNPIGDFPLNDDWVYGLAVKHMLANGDFSPGCTTATLVTNVLVGSLFSIPTGFSFIALRVSTLTLSLLGISATYLLMRELRQPRWLAALASITLAFTPIYYALSHTFMTDVPYTALTIMAAVFFVRNLRTGSAFAFFFGTILAVAATLSRQLAISVPLAFAVAFILKNGIAKRNILRAAISPVLCIGTLLVFQQWLEATGRLPAAYVAKNNVFFHSLTNPGTILVFAKNAYVALLYLGWFLLPVLVFVFGGILGSHRKKTLVLLVLSTSALVIGSVVAMAAAHSETRFLMPKSRNIILESGIGPLTLTDILLNLNQIPVLPTSFWIVVTGLSLLGAALLITAIGLCAINLAPKLWSAKMDDNEAGGAFLLLSVIIYLFPLLASGFFDRYLVPIIPLLAAGIVSLSLPIPRATTRVCRCAAVALLLALTFFAICGTRDYLAWNRLRWEALRDLTECKHVKVADIDGGYEFNGWHLYDPQYKGDPKKSRWWVQGDTYRIGFGSMPGYTVIKEYGYFHWMPPYTGKIVVLKERLLGTQNIRGNEHIE
ncbi:MAG: glycosyltransferase family 39 protein [Kiritimatiellia bacterium]